MLQPLETGQVWQVAGLNFPVGLIGKWLVHYNYPSPTPSGSPTLLAADTIEKYLKKNKAVLVKTLKIKQNGE